MYTWLCNRLILLCSPAYISADLRQSDTGLYTCKATSEAGETVWSAMLLVETQTNPNVVFRRTPDASAFPSAPARPNTGEIGESSMRVTWRPGTNQGASPVEAFTVEYYSQDTGEVRVLLLSFLSVLFYDDIL